MNKNQKFDQAIELRNLSKFSDAITIFSDFLEDEAFRYRALVECSMVYRAMGDISKSNEMLIHAVAEYADSIWARIHLGVNYRYQNKFNQSIRVLSAAVNIDPSQKYARYELAASYISNKLWDKAIGEVEQVIKIDKQFTQIYWLGFAVSLVRQDWKSVENYLISIDASDTSRKILEIIYKLQSNQILISDNDLNFVELYVKEFIQKINELLKFGVLDIDFLTKKTPSTLNDGVNLDYVYQFIFDSIEKKSPFSIMRIADGEGAIFEYLCDRKTGSLNNKEKAHKLLCGADIWKTWFGRHLSVESDTSLDNLSNKLIDAVQNASILCPPSTTNYLASSYVSYHGCRVAIDMAKSSKSVKYLSSIVPEDLFVKTDFFEKLFSIGRKVSLITCHPDLSAHLESRGVNVIQNIVIPWQKSNANIFNYPESSELHFVDAFPKIQDQINPDCDIYLVAAGVLGKVYCETIRSMGGRSFDLGALADAFCGFNTRPTIWKKWLEKPLW